MDSVRISRADLEIVMEALSRQWLMPSVKDAYDRLRRACEANAAKV